MFVGNDVLVGRMGVFVAIDVAVGGTGVLVGLGGDVDVTVGANAVSVRSLAARIVASAWAVSVKFDVGVSVGSAVAVGGSGVCVGSTVAVGGTEVAVNAIMGELVGKAVGVGVSTSATACPAVGVAFGVIDGEIG